MTGAPRRRSSPLLLAAGFSLWGGAFLLLYGALSLGCALGWHRLALPFGSNALRAGLVGLLLLVLAAHLWLWLRLRERSARAGGADFVLRVSAGAALAALAASVFTFFGTAMLTLCR